MATLRPREAAAVVAVLTAATSSHSRLFLDSLLRSRKLPHGRCRHSVSIATFLVKFFPQTLKFLNWSSGLSVHLILL